MIRQGAKIKTAYENRNTYRDEVHRSARRMEIKRMEYKHQKRLIRMADEGVEIK